MFFNKRNFDFESKHPDSELAGACFRKKRGMDNPERFRACFSDNMNRLLSFVYLPQIQFRIDLDGRLDETRLLDALELAVRTTPVLSCRYVEHPIRPYWERNPKADCRSKDVFCICQAADACFQDVLENFLSCPIRESTAPQIRVMVLRTASTDSLILKLNHQAADAFALQKFWVRNVMGRLMRIRHVPPVMTHMGGIDERRLNFGNPGVAAVELIAPPCYPPFFGVGLSGFRNCLSLSAGRSAASDFVDRAQALFDRVARELLLEIPKMRW